MTGLSSLYCSHLNKKIAELQSNGVERFLEQELLIPGLICRSLRTLQPSIPGNLMYHSLQSSSLQGG